MTYKPKHRDWTGLSEPDRIARNADAVRVVTNSWIMMEPRPVGLTISADDITSIKIEPGDITWYTPDSKFLEQYCVRTDV